MVEVADDGERASLSLQTGEGLCNACAWLPGLSTPVMIEEGLREGAEIFEAYGAVCCLKGLPDPFEPPLDFLLAPLFSKSEISRACSFDILRRG